MPAALGSRDGGCGEGQKGDLNFLSAVSVPQLALSPAKSLHQPCFSGALVRVRHWRSWTQSLVGDKISLSIQATQIGVFPKENSHIGFQGPVLPLEFSQLGAVMVISALICSDP